MSEYLPFGSLLFGEKQPSYGSIAASGSAKRKAKIKTGLKQINAVYQGGSAPFYSLARGKFKPNQTYYAPTSKGFKPYWNKKKGVGPDGTFTPSTLGKIVGSGGGDVFASKIFGALGLGKIFGGDKKSPEDVARKALERKQLYTGGVTENFEGFQPTFFQKRAQDYINFANPQLAEQYRLNRDAINYGLINRGLNTSSVADQARSRVERTADQGRQQIVDSGLEQSNNLYRDIEAARQENIRQLYQSASPAQGLQSAIASASSFRKPSVFAPLGDLFSGLAKQYYTSQILNNYRLGGQGNTNTNNDGTSNFAPI